MLQASFDYQGGPTRSPVKNSLPIGTQRRDSTPHPPGLSSTSGTRGGNLRGRLHRIPSHTDLRVGSNGKGDPWEPKEGFVGHREVLSRSGPSGGRPKSPLYRSGNLPVTFGRNRGSHRRHRSVVLGEEPFTGDIPSWCRPPKFVVFQ